MPLKDLTISSTTWWDKFARLINTLRQSLSTNLKKESLHRYKNQVTDEGYL